jgi:hypothetical protein
MSNRVPVQISRRATIFSGAVVAIAVGACIAAAGAA